MNITYTPGDRVITPDGPGVVTEPPYLMSSGWTVPVRHDTPVSASGEIRYSVDEVSAEPTKETPVNNDYAPGVIAARAINAHPWLSATYPELEDTDLLITPPWPAVVGDEAPGHIEGRITWEVRPNGNVIYATAIAYEGGPDGTVEQEWTATFSPARPLVWLDLARHVAGLVAQLHRIAHSDAVSV